MTKLLGTFFFAVFLCPFSGWAHEPVGCAASADSRTISLQDSSKKKVSLSFHDGKNEIRCPYRRGKVEDRTAADGVRTLRVRYHKQGRCAPKPLPGKALRQDLYLVIEIKGSAATARFDDPKKDFGAPCTLQNFRLSAFGLK